MGIGSSISESKSPFFQCSRQISSIFNDLLLEFLKRFCAGDVEGHRHCRKFVDVRPALLAWKDGRVDLLGFFLVSRDDDSPPWTTDRLVGRESRYVSNSHRSGIDTRNGHSGRMGDIGQEYGPNRVGNLSEFEPVRSPGIGGVSSDDHLRSRF